MATLLIVHHTVSPATRVLFEAVLEGVTQAREAGVEVTAAVRPALSATAADVLAADGVLLGTPANIGYMSGALKHFFDTVYYPLLDAKPALPYGLWLHGNEDTTGALRSVTAIAKALGWRAAAEPLVVRGAPAADDRAAAADLGATLAATVGS